MTLPSVTALLPYRDDVVRAHILEAKFHGNLRAQEALGNLLAHHLSRNPHVVLIPIPLGKRRLRNRGYNQTERIVSYATQRLTHAHTDSSLLTRTRDTLPQTNLSRQARLTNMQDAFEVTKPLDPTLQYLLIDDVVTTGATLRSARETLLRHGAHHVSAVALAH